ncbi:hypothetical protein G6F35_016727 [Rhizopus arrhizus]|nr:hypothetical protein G6F35_016727 [Rhizopus arrhizus]
MTFTTSGHRCSALDPGVLQRRHAVDVVGRRIPGAAAGAGVRGRRDGALPVRRDDAGYPHGHHAPGHEDLPAFGPGDRSGAGAGNVVRAGFHLVRLGSASPGRRRLQQRPRAGRSDVHAVRLRH